MRFSKCFIHTTKETPKDAVLASHKLLIRAGFISQLSAGIYDFLPLGKITLEKIKKVVKEELDNAGAQEVSLGFVTPADLWRESGRFERYGKELLRFNDRKNQEFVLGPTHEEVMVNLVRGRVTSYKQLPLNLYQINVKFRDEARPRFGLMRGREFLMKDGYSFHATHEDMLREFDLMEQTYKKIFKRLGLNFRVVEADSGAIGGSGSREFMVLSTAGEDTIVVCDSCEYAANIEAAKRKKAAYKPLNFELNREFHTPDLKTIEEVASFLNIDKSNTIKAVAKRALFDSGSQIAIFFVRGSDELEMTKAQNAIKANELVDISDEELLSAGVEAGFIGIDLMENILMVADSELENSGVMIAGANRKDFHKAVEIKDMAFKDLIAVQKGDICIECGGALNHTEGIEVGHIFQLGDRYSKPLNANFLDTNGKTQPFVMGTYGIGVSRLLSAIIEQSHDEKGCIWSKETAPFKLDLIVSNMKDSTQKEIAETVYKDLIEAEIEVLFDDRASSFGFKMSDFELIGFPYALIVGKKIQENIVEIVIRSNGARIEMGIKEAIDWIKKSCR